jgi:hypothetical protein
MHLEEQFEEQFEDPESDCFKPYVEDLLDNFDWPGSRHHY